nr:MAG TPA: hypothetical protein [Caudoviricetes sp.]
MCPFPYARCCIRFLCSQDLVSGFLKLSVCLIFQQEYLKGPMGITP